MKVSDAALRNFECRSKNLLNPQEVRQIRTQMRLTQREAGALLGGGPNRGFRSMSKTPSLASKPMSNLLRVLERHPEEVEQLKKQA